AVARVHRRRRLPPAGAVVGRRLGAPDGSGPGAAEVLDGRRDTAPLRLRGGGAAGRAGAARLLLRGRGVRGPGRSPAADRGRRGGGGGGGAGGGGPWGALPPTPELATLGGLGLRPAPVGAYPQGASAYGAEQMIGDVWEWTSSDFGPWPGFTPMIYRAYSEPFF